MATRAATFTAKIRTLYDYHLRTLHNILPLPSGIDIANTLKYFSQTLLGVLRDVPNIPKELMQSRELDHSRMSMFPNLDYKGLYNGVVQLVDIVPLIQCGATVLGQAILHALACLVPFLEHEYMDMLPYLVASSMAMFPSSLHKDIIDMLCNHLVPFTISTTSDPENPNYATLSTASIIMLIFQYTDNTAHHCHLLECLMSYKVDLFKDLICVIAHGTTNARAPAANLLFYYWPSLNPALHDRRGINVKFSSWRPLKCQRESCLSQENNEVVKMCLDHSVAIGSGDHPPPLYICQDCADKILREHPASQIWDVLLPVQQISVTCENKNCRSNDKTAITTCFSTDCISYNGNRPIRYCSQCHTIRHNNRRGADHVFHTSVGSPWAMDPETQGYMVEAIISLLKEAQPLADRRVKDLEDKHPRVALLDSEIDQTEDSALEERRLLSRYGIYLLVGLCTPNEDTPVETLGRLLGMLFQWFDATAYLPDDQTGNTLERLKSEYIHGWLMDVSHKHFEVFVSCLLPHPVEYARVGGHWDTLASRTSHIKDGFNRLFCLVPYEIISLEVWDYIMPYWMEAIRNEVPEVELPELRILLSKVLDPEMSPLGFDAHQMYRFISIRFRNTNQQVQEQALLWLQILSMLNVVVPLSLLFSMFNEGVQSCSSAPSEPPAEGAKVLHSCRDDFTSSVIGGGDDSRMNSPFSSDEQQTVHVIDFKSDAELNLPCFVLQLDVLLKQLELQDVDPHQGIDHIVSKESLSLIESMIKAPWVGTHTCKDSAAHDCVFCELATTFYQLSLEIIEYISPVMEVCKPDDEAEIVRSDNSSQKGTPVEERAESPKILNTDLVSQREDEAYHDASAHQVHVCAATVQTMPDTELDTVAIMPTEEVVKAVARAVTLTETDVGLAKVSVALPTIVDENDQMMSKDATEEDGNFWYTSQGKFKFTLEELPPQLQLIYVLLKELSKYESADILYHILHCLKVCCLHAECLTKAAKEQRGFLIWCQENLLLSNLWKLLQAEFSHISQVCVHIMMHCITLPSGADVFWKILDENFHSEDWTLRCLAVEKVTMIARFVEWEPIKQSHFLQSSLANAACHLISSMDDVNPTVAQKAMLCLDTIKESSLKCLCWCLEVQFDTVIVDRPMILQTLYQLYNQLSDHHILTWEFFLNRFDALFLEAQVSLEQAGEIAFPRVEREKLHNRQHSAPPRRKPSKFGIAQVVGQLPNHLFPDGNLKESLQGEDNINMLHRVMDMEDSDKDTIHLLIFLFMQFLSRPEEDYASDEKAVAKAQNYVFQRLNELLGYIESERRFSISPNRLRGSPVFNSFLFCLPRVLDHNFRMGTLLLKVCVPLLQYCPSPQRSATEVESPSYSLWYLEPYVRHSWLMSVLTLLYKYRYSSLPLSHQVHVLIRIVLNTLDAQDHRCHHIPDSCLLTTPNNRSRELSNMSAGDVPLGQDKESPPHSPGIGTEGSRITVAFPTEAKVVYQKVNNHEEEEPVRVDDSVNSESTRVTDRSDWTQQPWRHRKLPDHSFSSEVDEVEPELAAIPESPKSESPQPGSLQGSFGELHTLNEAVAEKAWVRIEMGMSPGEEDVVVMSPPVETALKAVSSPTSAGPVESQMAHQIRAFHESFDKKRQLPLESKVVTVFPVEPQSPMMVRAKEFIEEDKEVLFRLGSDDNLAKHDKELDKFLRLPGQDSVASPVGSPSTSPVPDLTHLIESRPPLVKASTVADESRENSQNVKFLQSTVRPKIAECHMTPSFQNLGLPESPSEESATTVDSKSKLQKSLTLDNSALSLSAKPELFINKLEVLDARQLEQSIRRRQPAVVSQCEQQQQSSYLFQPIQTHPITQIPEDSEKLKIDPKTSQPLKVEPRPSPVSEGETSVHSDPSAISCTIEVHSLIKLDPVLPVPYQENLLSIESAKISDKAKLKELHMNEADVSIEIINLTQATKPKLEVLPAPVDNRNISTFKSDKQFRTSSFHGPLMSSSHPEFKETKHLDISRDLSISKCNFADSKSDKDKETFKAKSSSIIPKHSSVSANNVQSSASQELSPKQKDYTFTKYIPPTKLKHVYSGCASKVSSHHAALSSTIKERQESIFPVYELSSKPSELGFEPLSAECEYNFQRSDSNSQTNLKETKNIILDNGVKLSSTASRDGSSGSSQVYIHTIKENRKLVSSKSVDISNLRSFERQSSLNSSVSQTKVESSHISCTLQGNQTKLTVHSEGLVYPDQVKANVVQISSAFELHNKEASSQSIAFSQESSNKSQTNVVISSAVKVQQSPSAVQLQYKESDKHVSHYFPSKLVSQSSVISSPKSNSNGAYQSASLASQEVIGWSNEAKLVESKAGVPEISAAGLVTMEQAVGLKSQALSEGKPETTTINEVSPKRLTKQSRIEPELQHQSSGSTEAASVELHDDDAGPTVTQQHYFPQDQDDQKNRPHFRRRKQGKIGISNTDLQKLIDQRNTMNRKSRKGELIPQTASQKSQSQPSNLRCGEDTVVERCPECGAIMEMYSDEELALCIVILATYVHREPALAAPMLPKILQTVARIASSTMYAWQSENNIYLPGGASSVAKQFLRCVLHQLAPNGLFIQLFQAHFDDGGFFKTVASSLTDFNELNPAAPLQLLLEGLNEKKVLPVETIQQVMNNVSTYMDCLPLETSSSAWSNIIPQFDAFFRKLSFILLGHSFEMMSTFKIMNSILKIPGLNSFKSILDPFSKVLSYAIQNSNLIYQQLLELCHLCNRAFSKERDKLLLSRTVVFELVQALKFKSCISDNNLLLLVQFIVQDAGGMLGPSIILEDLVLPVMDVQNMINTSACECMRQHLNDALEFVADVHTLSKVKSNFKGTLVGLNEDTLGATLKAGVAQYLALEITKGNSRDNRAISRYLPWLYNPPSSVQQGPREFLDCVAHIRLLSWLLLGALTHIAMLGNNGSLVCQPVPLEASCHIADHIQVILTGFAEQSKASVLHMSSLFHAFILCQLWTMYCEQMTSLNPPGSEHHSSASATLTDFWAKITPGILQLLSHSKVLADMVNLHFLGLMEALMECNSTILAKLFPMWSPVLYAYQGQLPGHLQVRLQACEDRCPSVQTKDEVASSTKILLKWLQRLQFKMGQIELQSSAATQFYSV